MNTTEPSNTAQHQKLVSEPISITKDGICATTWGRSTECLGHVSHLNMSKAAPKKRPANAEAAALGAKKKIKTADVCLTGSSAQRTHGNPLNNACRRCW